MERYTYLNTSRARSSLDKVYRISPIDSRAYQLHASTRTSQTHILEQLNDIMVFLVTIVQ